MRGRPPRSAATRPARTSRSIVRPPPRLGRHNVTHRASLAIIQPRPNASATLARGTNTTLTSPRSATLHSSVGRSSSSKDRPPNCPAERFHSHGYGSGAVRSRSGPTNRSATWRSLLQDLPHVRRESDASRCGVRPEAGAGPTPRSRRSKLGQHGPIPGRTDPAQRCHRRGRDRRLASWQRAPPAGCQRPFASWHPRHRRPWGAVRGRQGCRVAFRSRISWTRCG
jgi:hypothetical protein